MANIFSKQKDFVDKHKRNTFDLSFSNNLTFDFGQLVPVFCKEVLPGDSFRIKPSFGLRLMPLVFPIQTRMNANLHFFYVRNRNLWKDWPDFIGRTKSGLVPPYLSASQPISTCSLADYLGIPTTLIGSYGSGQRSFDLSACGPNSYFSIYFAGKDYNQLTGSKYIWPGTTVKQILDITNNPSFLSDYLNQLSSESASFNSDLAKTTSTVRGFITPAFSWPSDPLINPSDYFRVNTGYVLGDGKQVSASNLRFILFVGSDDNAVVKFRCDIDYDTIDDTLYYVPDGTTWHHLASEDSDVPFDNLASYLQEHYGSQQVRIGIFSFNNDYSGAVKYYDFAGSVDQFGFTDSDHSVPSSHYIDSIDVFDEDPSLIHELSDLPYTLSPYGTSSGKIHINALPFRVYDSIYNAFYRNQFNDPLIIDGQKEFNKFVRNNAGGVDTQIYQLYNRNYELDFLTSAKQSPVDGDITPLVGVNKSGDFTFQNPDETTYTVKPIIGADGHTLTGIESVEGTPANNSGLRRLVDMISIGISINDFRNVNALQRWLETNLRRGYRYKDQIMSHFGVDVKYDELDMPEFIGGMSEPVIVNQINQSVDQTGNESGLGDFSKVLGSYAGQASIYAESKHDITKYCDEHGFIMGILSVTPVPCYSQLLPKFMFKDNVLDYYFPEFGHIGNQPITYKEVCPNQVYAAGDSLNDVFGYQRAWYDLLASTDEVHGDFRNSLNGFLITRLFNSKPELGKSFIEVDKDSMTNPFSVTDDSNKILGQLYFDVTAQRAIPKFGIPRLE